MALKFKTISFVKGKVKLLGHDTIIDGPFNREGAKPPTDAFQFALQKFKALTRLVSFIDQDKVKEQRVTSIHLRKDGEEVKAHVTIYSISEDESPVNQQTPWYNLDSDQLEIFQDFDVADQILTMEEEALKYLAGEFKVEKQSDEQEHDTEEAPEPTEEMQDVEDEADNTLTPDEAAKVAEEIANSDEDGFDSGYGGGKKMGIAVNH